MKTYLNLLRDVKEKGAFKRLGNGTGVYSLFGRQVRFDLAEGFPLVTTKRLHVKSIIHELLWFLTGDTNIRYLQENEVRIWSEWATVEGDLGPVYGQQWRAWQSPDGRVIDQIEQVCRDIQNNPHSSRLVVSAWNPAVLPDDQLAPRDNAALGRQALTPTHCLFQFYVAQGKLSCQLYQRSGDVFLGVPLNIATYALLTMMMAQVTGLEVGEFVHTFGELHLHESHVEQAQEQLERTPMPLPTMVLNPYIASIFDFTYGDFSLKNYQPHPPISAPVAV